MHFQVQKIPEAGDGIEIQNQCPDFESLIGVSHLIQSTRAGEDFGLMIIGFVVLVSVLKYHFFEYGSRYAISTQTSIIDGYKNLGTSILIL